MAEMLNRAPGVYRQDVFPTPAPGFLTGVPVFLGYAEGGPDPNEPQVLTLWPQYEDTFGPAPELGYLAYAVRGFFENDGLLCYVHRLEDTGDPREDLRDGLEAVAGLDDVDLVCAPDIMRTASSSVDPDPDDVGPMQRDILDHCEASGHRFAILDCVPSRLDSQLMKVAGDLGALYHPWVWTPGLEGRPAVYVPPCGHVAGAYSRSDRDIGVHKAPANEVVEGVQDLRVNLGEREVGMLNARGVNCLRAFPGRGVRIWGARTLSDDPAWQHVNVRRIFLALGRWLERFMGSLVHEPNDVRLWVRIMRDLSVYLEDLYRRGALKGRSPAEAFFVKCDDETNTGDVIDAGLVVTQVGLAPLAPAEFVVVRIIHGSSGVSITTND